MAIHDQTLQYGLGCRRLWKGYPRRDGIFYTHVLASCTALPFFALAGCLIWYNDKEVTPRQLNILDDCIRAVSWAIDQRRSVLIDCRLPHYCHFSSLLLWAEPRLSLLLGNLNEVLHSVSWSSLVVAALWEVQFS